MTCRKRAEFIADQMNFLNKKTLTVLIVVALTAVAVLVIKSGYWFEQSTGLRCGGSQCNVIMIISDTLSAQHMSVYGYERDTTPFMKDYFEKEGIIFDSASSTASWTMPSFASMFRSRYPSEIKMSELAKKQDSSTFVDVLRKNGVNVVGLVESGQLIKESIENVFDESEVLGGEGEGKFISAGQWLKENQKKGSKKPFFMMLHDWTVHDPYIPPEKYQKMFGEPETYQGPVTHDDIEKVKKDGFQSEAQRQKFVRRYDQGVRHLDDLVKNFIESMDKETLDSSIIIVTGDHGEGFNEHGYFYHGAHIYDEFVRVPMLVRYPGNSLSGSRVNNSVSLLDMAPTVLNIFGIEKPQGYLGHDFLPLVQGKNLPEWITKSELGGFELSLGENTKSFERLSSDILESTVFSETGQFSLRKENWKLIKSLKGLELFNLNVDSLEKNNLINSWQDENSVDKNTIQELLEKAK